MSGSLTLGTALSTQMDEQQRNCGWGHPFDNGRLCDIERTSCTEFRFELVRQTGKRRIVKIGRDAPLLVALLIGDCRSLPVKIN